MINIANYRLKQVLLTLLLALCLPALAGEPEAPQQPQTAARGVFTPGDAVYISVFPDTSSFLNGTFPIDDRGFVELPMYGKAKISHLSRDQFVGFIRENFRDYLRFPNIYVKPMIRVSVLGGVPKPGLFYFDPDASFWEVMFKVNGTVDEDGLKKMKWQRSGKNVQDNLIPDFQSGVSLRQMGFRSGDQVWVRTPTKPGLLDKTRNYLTFITTAASIATLYFTYVRVIQGRNI